MRFDLDISQHQLTWDELLARARLAEEHGFGAAWCFDHFKPLYGDPTGPCFEAWTLLAALAASTQRVRLGALVTGITYRHPSVLTAEAVTVDHVSAGRLEIGLGAAWFEQEHRELGIPFPSAAERMDRLSDAVAIMRALMTDDGVSYEGNHHVLREATYRPRPVQRPHPPIWIGGSGRGRTLPLVGRVADVWHSFIPPAQQEGAWDIVRGSAEEAGRDPSVIRRSISLSLSQPWDDVRRDIDAAAEAGIDVLIVSWPSEGRDHLEGFIADVLPGYR